MSQAEMILKPPDGYGAAGKALEQPVRCDLGVTEFQHITPTAVLSTDPGISKFFDIVGESIKEL